MLIRPVFLCPEHAVFSEENSLRVVTSDIGRRQRRRDRPLDAATGLARLPRMGEDARRPAENEESANQFRRTAERGIDVRGRAVDIHGHRIVPALRQCLFESQPAVQSITGDGAFCHRFFDEFEECVPARIHGVESVSESRHVNTRDNGP